jgi:hypothetical protein
LEGALYHLGGNVEVILPIRCQIVNERAAKWYSSYGAIPLADAPLSLLLLPLATVQKALESAGKQHLKVIRPDPMLLGLR